MIISIFRLGKRFAVLLPALLVAYVSIFNVFPFLNDDLPILLALLITYLFTAYLLIPALLRLVRIAFPVRHLPLYCLTADGFASDPLNIGLLGTQQQLVTAMKAAGWQPADRITIRSVVRVFLSYVRMRTYQTAPMSNLFLFGRRQDLSFQRQLDDPELDSRHHVRFWAAEYDSTEPIDIHGIDWRTMRHLPNQRYLWVGAASKDIGITLRRHSFQLTHLVDSDTDGERERLVKDLAAVKARLRHTVKLDEPYSLRNIHALRGRIHTDAMLKVLELRQK